MKSDNLAKQLHDKFTRGKPLSSEEQTLLEEWYTHHDEIENNLLVNSYEKTRVESLQNQVNTALNQLMTVTKQVQEIAVENETLKSEVHELREHWVQQSRLSLA
jgi:peptidoglycan hydrolase CwlO-like protein